MSQIHKYSLFHFPFLLHNSHRSIPFLCALSSPDAALYRILAVIFLKGKAVLSHKICSHNLSEASGIAPLIMSDGVILHLPGSKLNLLNNPFGTQGKDLMLLTLHRQMVHHILPHFASEEIPALREHLHL